MHEWKGFVSKDALSENLITWIFEEDSFSPIAKVKGNKYYSILADHLGTPIEAYEDDGNLIWSRELNSNGKTKTLVGSDSFCNFTFQGQSYDADIDLCYNRMRWYDQNDGKYLSQDPIGLLSGEFNFYAYVEDTNTWIDIFGLTGIIYLRTDPKTKKEYIGKSKSPEAFEKRKSAHNTKRKNAMGNDYDNKKYDFEIKEENVSGKKKLQNREQVNINKKGGIKNLENQINAKRKKKGYKK